MNKNLLYTLFILLGVVALVFGYSIYQQSLSTSDKSYNPNPEPILPTTPTTDQPPPPTVTKDDAMRSEILAFPGKDATDEEIRQHKELIMEKAVYTSLLDIGDCTPNPLVLKVNYGDSVTITNSGLTEHTLSRGDTTTAIPVGGTEEIVISDFVGLEKGGGGFAGYGCDNVLAGIFFINAIENPE